MVDLVSMQCENMEDGSIKLHQSKYVKKLMDRFLPDGPPSHVKPDCLPYTPALPKLIEEAIAAKEANGIEHPDLITRVICFSSVVVLIFTPPFQN